MQILSAPSQKSPVSPGWIRRQLREIGAKQSTESAFESFEHFCALIKIRPKSGPEFYFRPETWHEEQRRFNAERTGRDLVLKGRQVGFTTLELARDLHYALINPGTNVWVIAHDGKLVENMHLTLRHFADCLEYVGKLPKRQYSNKRELVFAHTGSAVRVVESGATSAAAEKKGRSGTIHRLHATEVAFWGAASETMGAVLGAVPDDGEIVIESTPNGVGGLFYQDVQAAREGRTAMRLHFFAWWQHAEYRVDALPAGFDPQVRRGSQGKPDPWETKLRGLGCDDGQIARWRSWVDDPKVGLERALQEYPIDIDTCFRAIGNAWFEPEVLDRIADLVCEPIRLAPITYAGQQFEPARIYANPCPGRRYVVFGDVSEGVSGDGSSAHVLDAVSGETVATWWSDSTEPGDFGAVLAVLGWLYNRAVVSPERNNHGHATLERLLKAIKYPAVYYADDGRPGFNTNKATRPVLWDDLAHAIREGAAWTPDAATLAECRSIVRDDDGKPRARGKRDGGKDASRDDRYVSWAGAWLLRSQAVPRVTGMRISGL